MRAGGTAFLDLRRIPAHQPFIVIYCFSNAARHTVLTRAFSAGWAGGDDRIAQDWLAEKMSCALPLKAG